MIQFYTYLFCGHHQRTHTREITVLKIFSVFIFLGGRVNNKIKYETNDSSSYFEEFLCIPASSWGSNELAQKSARNATPVLFLACSIPDVCPEY